MPFPTMYSKLGHKLTNVEMTRINKELIAFVYWMSDFRITLWKHTYSASVYAKSAFPITPKHGYIVRYLILFPMMYNKLAHKLRTVEMTKIKLTGSYLCLYINATTELHCANIYIYSKCLFRNSTILCSSSCSFQWCTVNCGTSSPRSKRQGLIWC